MHDQTTAKTVHSLRQQMRRIEEPKHLTAAEATTSGCSALDQLLPDDGFRRGTLVEWFAAGSGSGAGILAMIAARQACVQGGSLVVVDRSQKFYPPAAAALSLDLNRLIVVRPRNQQDEHWALDQALRCKAVSAVWAPVENLDERTFRRLQLAAETSGCLGLLMRPAIAQGQPAWSEVQLAVTSRPSLLNIKTEKPVFSRRLQVHVIRCRGMASGGTVELKINEATGVVEQVSRRDETHSLHLASQLAHPTSRRRATGT